MKIFYGDSDYRNRSNTRKYAYLNWCFDNGYGGNDNPHQYIYDNHTLGRAFVENALLTLYDIIEDGNSLYEADSLIFPILFNSWHGLELWLKSSIASFTLSVNKEAANKTGHDIVKLASNLIDLLKTNNCTGIISAISSMSDFISEFARVNARFDFSRYTFDINRQFQFYNALYNSDKQWQKSHPNLPDDVVPNTCVDIINLYDALLRVYKDFGTFVEYLTFCISEGDVISDENYQNYLRAIENIE